MKKVTIILIISLFSLHTKGQTRISDYLDVSTSRNHGIKKIDLYTLDGNKKILIERNEFNSKERITKEMVYCNSLNDPMDEIEITTYNYDKSDTLLIGQSYGIKKRDTTDLVYSNTFSYTLNNKHQLFKKKTIDTIDHDIEEETYFYNEVGQLNKKRIDFYNKTGDTVIYYFTNLYEHDSSGNVIKDAFISDDSTKYERLYAYGAFRNMLTYKFKGRHIDNYDIDQITITYNKHFIPAVKEVYYAGGEQLSYKYTYNRNCQLTKVLVSSNDLKHRHLNRKGKIDTQSPPLPPSINDYNKYYRKDYKYYCYYKENGLLFKVLVKYLRFKLNETYIFEYE